MRTSLVLVLVFVLASCGGMTPAVESAEQQVAQVFASYYGVAKKGCTFRHLGNGRYVAENCRTERCDSAVMIRGENCTHEQFTEYECKVTHGSWYQVECRHTRCPYLGVNPSDDAIDKAVKQSLGGGYWGCYTFTDQQPVRGLTTASNW